MSDSGIFELFVPGLPVGTLYKYEIKAKNGLVFLKADPYANADGRCSPGHSLRGDGAYPVLSGKMQDWMAGRKKHDLKKEAMAVYEMHLASWKQERKRMKFLQFPGTGSSGGRLCEEDGLHPCGADARHGASFWMNPGVIRSPVIMRRRASTVRLRISCISWITCTGQGIGVILDWVPAHFPKYDFGLGGFDGTCLYEHLDPRQGIHPAVGYSTFINYGTSGGY